MQLASDSTFRALPLARTLAPVMEASFTELFLANAILLEMPYLVSVTLIVSPFSFLMLIGAELPSLAEADAKTLAETARDVLDAKKARDIAVLAVAIIVVVIVTASKKKKEN